MISEKEPVLNNPTEKQADSYEGRFSVDGSRVYNTRELTEDMKEEARRLAHIKSFEKEQRDKAKKNKKKNF